MTAKTSIKQPKFRIGDIAIFDGESWYNDECERIKDSNANKNYPGEEDSEMEWFSSIYYTEKGIFPSPIQVEVVSATYWGPETHEGWSYRVKFRDIEDRNPTYDEAIIIEKHLLEIK